MEGPTYEIVGVAGNVGQMGLDASTLPEVYVPFAQDPSAAMVLMIRGAPDPGSLAASVRKVVDRVDHDVPVQDIRPLDRVLGATLDRRRFGTLLLTLFSGVALLLAFVGIFGMLSAWVATRESDIAIRIALGADRGTVIRWAGTEALRLCLKGFTLGGLAAWAVARSIEGLLFSVTSRNPAAVATATFTVIAMAAAAAALPLRRAARIDAARKLLHG
jgi:predicted lysophospholipase L1 biosynthesis ABC-type transport system permease subunit